MAFAINPYMQYGSQAYNTPAFGGYTMPTFGAFTIRPFTPFQNQYNSYQQNTFQLTSPFNLLFQSKINTIQQTNYLQMQLQLQRAQAQYQQMLAQYQQLNYQQPRQQQQPAQQSQQSGSSNTPTNVMNLLKQYGYNAQKGQHFSNVMIQGHVGFKSRCARYVSNGLVKAGLSNGLRGNGCDMDTVLSKNRHFKQIPTNGLDLEQLPAGCVLVYEAGVSGYHKRYGHVEVTDGKGNAYSDGKTRNIRKGAKVFIPV